MKTLKRYISIISNTSKQYSSKEAREEAIKEAREAHTAFCKRINNTDYKFKVKRSTKSFGYANLMMYTDIVPFEIINVISAQTIEIRRMDSKINNKEDLQFQSGGFSAHCINNHAQQYDITSNEDMPIIRARLRKDGYFHSCSGRHSIDNGPSKHYDFNF